MKVHNTAMDLRVKTMQFGQPYEVGAETMIAERDGVNLSILTGGTVVINVRLTPEQALEVSRLLAERAKEAHANVLTVAEEPS
ncbi:hypothetical protein SEA_PUREGLOBE5_2 [Arthrobacter phage Pureglobe5]|nr:hypothetical protein PBI_BEAGLE_2 [Arthrobacter phage Beagle]UYL87365.1 hypothetical protein SEA_PUREGLOBE5_2 [Arthrobacter phage Pureglobe5]